MACVCCTVSIGLAIVVWTLGLAERTEPLALPYTVTCSTGGPSVDCMAVKEFENVLLNAQVIQIVPTVRTAGLKI